MSGPYRTGVLTSSEPPTCRGWYPPLPRRGYDNGVPFLCWLFGHAREACVDGCHTKCIFCGKPRVA